MDLANKLLGGKKIKPWGVAALSAVSVGLPTIPAFAENSFGPYYIGTCMLCAGVASFFTLHTSKSSAESERSAVLEHAIEPLSSLIGKLLEHPQDFEEKRENIFKRLVETAGELAHASASSGLYWLSDNQAELNLVSCNDQGRQQRMPETFSRGTDKGSFLVETALSAAGRLVQNISKDPDRDRIYMVDDCRSAVFLPVRTGTTTQGLIIIQCLKPGHIPKDFRDDKRLKSIVNLIGVAKLLRKPSDETNLDIPGQAEPPAGDAKDVSI
ncbi:hypothetical protein AB0O75_49170 [Streptomyces sp. NPDC088921]|uniref:hypothetical protein n=1 Tax=unclassified Streptomyces TaxID=2593676 RepID=UPI00343EB8B3